MGHDAAGYEFFAPSRFADRIPICMRTSQLLIQIAIRPKSAPGVQDLQGALRRALVHEQVNQVGLLLVCSRLI